MDKDDSQCLGRIEANVELLVARVRKEEEDADKLEHRVRGLEKSRNLAAGAVAVLAAAGAAVWKVVNG